MLATTPTANVSFTGWSLPAGVGDHFNNTVGNTALSTFTDCQFSGGKFTLWPGSVSVVNSLWQRVYVTLRDEASCQWHLFNNLFYGGTLWYKAIADNPVLEAYDNFFDRTTITRGSGSEYFTHNHNGYITGQSRLQPPQGNDQTVTSAEYATGPLGRYYQTGATLSAFENHGSRAASAAGLSGYTVRVDQTPDTGQVDIGFHYKALTAGGVAAWWFTDQGFIGPDGSLDGGFRAYNDPSSVPASPWSFVGGGQNSVRISFENDNNCDHPPPFNPYTQIGTAEAVVFLNNPTRLTVSWTGVAEQQYTNYELMDLFVDGCLLGHAHAPGGYLECAPMAGVVSSPNPPQSIILQAGLHVLRIATTTNDALYHFGAYYEFALQLTSP